MTATDDAALARLEMSLALAWPLEPKILCRAQTKPGPHGVISSSCDAPKGHDPSIPHRDMHTGATWKDQS
jgi:hypothetical protein